MRCAGRGVVESRRISRKPFADRVNLGRFIGWRQNFRGRRRTLVDQQSRVRCAVVQAGGPHRCVDGSIWHRFSAITRDGSVREAMKCEIRIGQEGHRSDARDLKEEKKEESGIRLH